MPQIWNNGADDYVVQTTRTDESPPARGIVIAAGDSAFLSDDAWASVPSSDIADDKLRNTDPNA